LIVYPQDLNGTRRSRFSAPVTRSITPEEGETISSLTLSNRLFKVVVGVGKVFAHNLGECLILHHKPLGIRRIDMPIGGQVQVRYALKVIGCPIQSDQFFSIPGMV
jgi:hypothetical protein